MKHLYKVLLFYSILMLLASCRGDEPKRMPDTIPDINGNIESVVETNAAGNNMSVQLLVEAAKDVQNAYPGASIKVDDSTLIENKDGKRIKAGQLREGQRVEIWFEGAVMESEPVQATAKAIRVDLSTQ